MSATYEVTLLRSERVAEGTTAFHFAKPDAFSYRPGQYVDVSLVAPRERDPAGNLRSFSLVSAPHEPSLTIATRMRGSPFKRDLAALPVGAGVRVTGPEGELALDDDEPCVVFVAGGIGITPFMSMLRDAAQRRSERAITLIYGNRTPAATAFMTELEALGEHLPGLRLVHCMSEPDAGWTGERGFVTEKLLARYIDSPDAPLYYVVGPPAMTAALQETLMGLGVPDDRVRVEAFAGY